MSNFSHGTFSSAILQMTCFYLCQFLQACSRFQLSAFLSFLHSIFFFFFQWRICDSFNGLTVGLLARKMKMKLCWDFALLVSVYLLICCMTCAYAAHAASDDNKSVVQNTAMPRVTNWEYKPSTKTLFITGTGTMNDYNSEYDVPWYLHREEIQNVVINDGITKIGSHAFCMFTSLSSIDIPQSVTHIGLSAFGHCRNLTSITLPENITQLMSRCFEGCTKLGNITIPSKVFLVGDRIFSECPNMESITVSKDNWYYKDDNGVLMRKTGTELIQFPCGRKGDYSIPPEITKISVGAFRGCSLTSLNLTGNSTSDLTDMFTYSANLETVILPDNATSVGNQAFRGCPNLKSIQLPSNLTFIEDYAFNDCPNLETIIIPDNATTVGIGAFSDCTRLKSIKLPSNLTSISDLAFFNCSNLETIIIPDNVTSIGKQSFADCTSLKSIKLPSNITSIADSMFHNCSNLETIVLPDCVALIGNQSFSDCTSLKSINFPSNLTSINESAFCNCTSLETIVLPGSITSIGPKAFSGSGLVSLSFMGCPQLSDSCSAFEGCDSLNTINIPEPCNLTELCGRNITPLVSNECYEMVERDGNYFFSKKTTAREWEEQTNDCIHYWCDNESGYEARSKCDNEKNIALCNDNGQCMDEEFLKDKPRALLELKENVTITETYVEVLTELREIVEDVSLAIEYNDDGQMVHITVYVNDESQAVLINTAVNNCR